MPTITFIDANGLQTAVEAEVGESLMKAAIRNDVRGIDADCGGLCACGTCHVYIESPWRDGLTAPSDMERDLVSFTVEPRETSRLACQVVLDASLEGMVVRLPDQQH